MAQDSTARTPLASGRGTLRSWVRPAAIAAVSTAAVAGTVVALCSWRSGDGRAAADHSFLGAPKAQASCGAWSSHGRKMDCGGASLCGVLTLETGKGSGYYQHPAPAVHGLWPETGSYGTSKCVPPKNSANPTSIYSCYKDESGGESHQLDFETHEWTKHGVCSGVRDVTDFFDQICSLSAGPLKVMAGARAAGLDLVDTADQLQRSGYCVFNTMDQFQVSLSACAGLDGKWKLADVSDFSTVCGGSGPSPAPSPSPSPSPTPTPSTAKCVKSQHGPPCTSDKDCAGLEDCVRCAHSGFCTDVPASWLRG